MKKFLLNVIFWSLYIIVLIQYLVGVIIPMVAYQLWKYGYVDAVTAFGGYVILCFIDLMSIALLVRLLEMLAWTEGKESSKHLSVRHVSAILRAVQG